MFPGAVLREEEEWGGGAGGAYTPEAGYPLSRWWNELEGLAPEFPMYAMFLATDADSELISFIEGNRDELREISGRNCCFIYFRDPSAALVSPWRYSEHAKLVIPVARLVGVPLNELPCVLFFRKFADGTYWREPLSSADTMWQVRVLFDDIQWDSANPFSRHKRIVFWKKASAAIKDSAQEIARQWPKLFEDLASKLVKG
jgi:hypothetical protein